MKVSFDFDGCLSEKVMQNLAKKFIKLGAEVFVVTSRATELHSGIKLNNNEVFEITDALGIKRENIIFTAYEDKYLFLKEIDCHFDDDFEQIFLINQYPGKTMGFIYESKYNNGIIQY